MTGLKSRPRAVLASAALTLLAFAVLGVLGSPSSEAQSVCVTPTTFGQCPTTTTVPTTTTPDPTPPTVECSDPAWCDSKWTSPADDVATVHDSTFRGTFVHHGPGQIDTLDLDVTYADPRSFPAACGAAPGAQPTQHPTAPLDDTGTSTADFLFEVGLECNGIYNVVPTAKLDVDGPGTEFSMRRDNLRVAIPPQQPPSFSATDNGNQTVTLTWQPPDNQPPDLAGYRVSRRDAGSQNFTVLMQTDRATFSYVDPNIPPGGGSFVYQVQTLRTSPDGTLASRAVQTAGALAVAAAGSGRGGGTVKGTVTVYDPGSGGTGTQTFDDPSGLPGEDGEPGGEDPILPNVPGAQTVQRFVDDHGGAGLVTPIAGALNLGVWAGLLLFLTRRAASAERALLVSVEFEDAP